MIDPTTRSPNAFIAVAQRARQAHDHSLVALEVAGFSIAICLITWLPGAVELTLLSSAAGLVGLWGVTEHKQAQRWPEGTGSVAETIFRHAVAAAATIAALGAGFYLAGRMMGVFIL